MSSEFFQGITSWVQDESSHIVDGKIVKLNNVNKDPRSYSNGTVFPNWEVIKEIERNPSEPEKTIMKVEFHYKKEKIPIYQEIFNNQKEILILDEHLPYHRILRGELAERWIDWNEKYTKAEKMFNDDYNKILDIIKNNPHMTFDLEDLTTTDGAETFEDLFSKICRFESGLTMPEIWYAEAVRSTIILPWTSDLATLIREKCPEKQHKILGGCF